MRSITDKLKSVIRLIVINEIAKKARVDRLYEAERSSISRSTGKKLTYRYDADDAALGFWPEDHPFVEFLNKKLEVKDLNMWVQAVWAGYRDRTNIDPNPKAGFRLVVKVVIADSPLNAGHEDPGYEWDETPGGQSRGPGTSGPANKKDMSEEIMKVIRTSGIGTPKFVGGSGMDSMKFELNIQTKNFIKKFGEIPNLQTKYRNLTKFV